MKAFLQTEAKPVFKNAFWSVAKFLRDRCGRVFPMFQSSRPPRREKARPFSSHLDSCAPEMESRVSGVIMTVRLRSVRLFS